MQKAAFLGILAILTCTKLIAQNSQISLSFTYGVTHTDYINYAELDRKFKAAGASFGLEFKSAKHLTLGVEVDWQRFEPEPAIAVAPTSPNLPNLIYSIDRHQFNLRPTLRYYFRKAFTGLYVGAFGTYTYLTVKTSDYPKDSGYFPDLYADPTDDFGLGGGLTYGYRLKLTPALQVSAFGSHQIFWSDTPKYQQQDHQFGLGLNWIF